MSADQYLEQLSEIRSIMRRSNKFISLSGMSGILTGIYALIGAYLARKVIYRSDEVIYYSLQDGRSSDGALTLLLIAAAVAILASVTVAVFSLRKARKVGESILNPAARRLITHFALPMIVGGIFVLILLQRGHLDLIAGSTLVFYGLGLLNAGNYTYGDIRKLGLCEVLVGLLALIFPGQGLIFWAIGFGILHIIYGVLMYYKYEQ